MTYKKKLLKSVLQFPLWLFVIVSASKESVC
jgi:hypothetical protein